MKAVLRAIAAVAALSCAACSSFNQDWKQAAAAPARDPFAGAYEGRWTSAKHRGASGRLRCVFTRMDDTRYHGRFRANWMAFVSGYDTTFRTARRGDALEFQGEHDIGALWGGVYRYSGRIERGRFAARYTSSYDEGTFEMTRQLTKPGRIP
ncbi:MAG: hypothetical protein M3463_22725 [Verrucomicrobiota bacterium]|nr:hypothetical protein [Verrucomicrobiota bacterium]